MVTWWKIYIEVAALILTVEFINELAFHFPDKNDINKGSYKTDFWWYEEKSLWNWILMISLIFPPFFWEANFPQASHFVSCICIFFFKFFKIVAKERKMFLWVLSFLHLRYAKVKNFNEQQIPNSSHVSASQTRKTWGKKGGNDYDLGILDIYLYLRQKYIFFF